MTTLSEEQLNELSAQLRETTLEDLLLVCIRDTGLMDTVCMLDIIATQTGQRIAMFNWKGRTYPADGGDLTIPVPQWKKDLLSVKDKELYPIKREETDVIPIADETNSDGEKNSVEESQDTQPKETNGGGTTENQPTSQETENGEEESEIIQNIASTITNQGD